MSTIQLAPEGSLRTAVLELPLELVLYIIQISSLTHEDALSLALTCRHLHRFLIPHLLEEFGVHGRPGARVSLDLQRYTLLEDLHDCSYNPYAVECCRSPDSLTMINLAFHLSTIPKLECTLHGVRLKPIVHQINRLRTTLSRFSSVNEVELVFGQATHHHCTLGDKRTPDDEVRLWTESLGSLLNTILEKGGKRLAVREGMVMTCVYFGLPPLILEHRTTLRRGFIALRLALQRAKRYPTSFNIFKHGLTRSVIVPAFPDSNQSQIVTFEISSQILFTTPFSQWTFCLIKSSPSLTTLVLSDLALSQDTWSEYLSFLRVCLSNSGCELTSFSFLRCPSAPVRTINSFLRHLPSLVTLILDSSPALKSPTKAFKGMPIPFLPHLKTLQGSMAYLLHLLQLPHLPLSPASRVTRIASNKGTRPLPHLDELRVCLRYTSLSAFTRKEKVSPIPLQIKEKCSDLTLVFESHFGWDTKFINADPSVDLAPPEVWASVSGLIIPLKCFGFRNRIPRASKNLPRSVLSSPSIPGQLLQSSKEAELYQQQQTCRFINEFVSVERVSIVEYPFRNFHGNLPLKPPSKEDIQYLLGALWPQCPRIQSIELVGVMYRRPSIS
ncbi:hypothetical protein BDN72DRAFT_964584 [Pluteus cervinus]|uniref:Uncharacterized protein n=1 Tax=Pluteus cervinus TaxID=181527 RepID=A0ACD3A9R2_9AGAR|nr:hypothetical protein BDN72DRAFT_964584 [Pluteus cervinus]